MQNIYTYSVRQEQFFMKIILNLQSALTWTPKQYIYIYIYFKVFDTMYNTVQNASQTYNFTNTCANKKRAYTYIMNIYLLADNAGSVVIQLLYPKFTTYCNYSVLRERQRMLHI